MKKVKLRYHIYDFDNNILNLDTKIILEKLENNIWKEVYIPTDEYSVIRNDKNYRIPYKINSDILDYDKAFKFFRDEENDEYFLNDVKKALDNKKYAVSFNAFKETLTNGKLFGIVTARGNHPSNIRKGIEYIIENELTNIEKNVMLKNLKKYCKLFNYKNSNLLDNYLSLCEYLPISSNTFINSITPDILPDGIEYDKNNIKLSKMIAVNKFTKKCIAITKNMKNFHCKITFSDDDKLNINSIHNLFLNKLKKEYPDIEFNIFDTSPDENGNQQYKKIVI